tara:strand:+ start:20580 stop:20924 length:345 start_codon:yes stop_codon:yes gene_type:complete
MKINILQLSLIVSLFGIFILLILLTLSPKLITINKINPNLLNKQIKVNARVLNIKNYEKSNFQIIRIKDNSGEIDITLDKIINILKNQNIQVIGKITEYNNTLQITADKIISIS